jgi:uncharacterized damage-inducible protein DinB
MNTPQQIAKQLRQVHFGGNWTAVNLQDTLADVSWKEATTVVDGFNSIATLVYHINYYVDVLIPVFEGKPLVAKDEYSFNHPPINNQNDWETFLKERYNKAEKLATLIEKLPETELKAPFTDRKYGSYYRNLHGLIQHTHYHLGQIVFLKKMLRN